MACQLCNETTHTISGCRSNRIVEICYQAEQFVCDTISDDSVSDEELSDHILRFIATFSYVELYLLAKHLPGFRPPGRSTLNSFKAVYVELIHSHYLKNIKQMRRKNLVIASVYHIVNTDTTTEMYDRIVYEVMVGGRDVNELLESLQYGVDNNLYDNRVVKLRVMFVCSMIYEQCVVRYDNQGIRVLQFTGRSQTPMSKYVCTILNDGEHGAYTCGVCYEEFETSNNRVYMGNCTHSFCSQCIHSHITYNLSYISCPFCRTETTNLLFTSEETLMKTVEHEEISIMDYIH